MRPNPILDSFLANQGYVLFEYLGDEEFLAIGHYPSWCKEIWEIGAPKRKKFRLAEKSPFLENFLLDAGEFWKSKGKGSLDSGNWIERAADGREIPLEASALVLDGKRILILRNLSSTFGEQQRLFQTARDSLLAHEKLVGEIQKKEILLHCIIHDLSQPLSAMSGCFNLLLLEHLPAELKKFAQAGQRESQRQELMIRGILSAFSGDLEAQRSPKDFGAEAPNLAACAQQALEEFSAVAREKGVHLRLDPSLNVGLDWRVVGDVSRLGRIFGNLLENALRHSPKGTTVTIGIEDRGSSVFAFVDDEGPGLPNDQPMSQLFALFAKGKTHSGKAGLGLYFCKITVERWGGAIGAETRASGGSRFWFKLLRAAKAPQSAGPQASTKPESLAVGPADSGKPSKRLRVLIAEDTDLNRDLVVELLKKRGHIASSARDGFETLAALERSRFDVVLMDEEMPRMNGRDATRAIRQRERSTGQHVVIIGLTGNATPEDEQRCLDAGMDAFMAKPVPMEKLFQAVESATYGPRQLAQAAPADIHQLARGLSASQSVSGSDVDSESVAVRLRHNTGGSEKLQQSLVKTFLSDAPKTLLTIRHAIANNNAQKLASAAHALKGSLGIFGAPKAVAAAYNLQTMGRTRDLRAALPELRALETEFTRLRQDLLALRASLQPHKKRKSKKNPARKAKRKRKPTLWRH